MEQAVPARKRVLRRRRRGRDNRMTLQLTQEDRQLLQQLEEDLWREETRFDIPYVE